MTLYVILFLVALGIGMAVSVAAFGTGGKRKNIFKDIYFSVEETDDGIGVMYTKNGDFAATLSLENPVEQYCADTDAYYSYASIFTSIIQTLGEGYAIQKQDVFSMEKFAMEDMANKEYLSEAYFKYFNGRPYTEGRTYLTIVQEKKKGTFGTYDAKQWKDFMVKLRKVHDLLRDNGIKAQFLGKAALQDYVDRFFAVSFKKGTYSMSNFMADEEGVQMGDRQFKVYSLVDVDHVTLPRMLKPYTEMEVNNTSMPVDLMQQITTIPGADTVVYNQFVYIPGQKRELALLDKKKNRHGSMPDPANQMAVEDIKAVQDVIARESKMLVYTHYNLMVCCPKGTDMQKPTNHLENAFSRLGIHISKHAFNQLELFVGSFPGNCYQLDPEYDRFLTLSDAAMCLMYKERLKHSEDTPLKIFYTDRQGVPVAIDITGKEGRNKLTDNSNFFCLGPSGSGKSFHMNSVVRQLWEQDTDIVMVDTGNSYEGLCEYVGGKYISYTNERPITMNPFRINEQELNVEKIGFLKNLVLLIWKGPDGEVSKEEDKVINMVIEEYFAVYFHPESKTFTDEQKKDMARSLRIDMSTEDDSPEALRKRQERIRRFAQLKQRLEAAEAQQSAASETQPMDARQDSTEIVQIIHNETGFTKEELLKYTPEELCAMENERLQEGSIQEAIDKMESRRQKLEVESLSFNTFYEYAIQRIPYICKENSIMFNIASFRFMMKDFYKGGTYEKTLNEDFDGTLFDETFIVFEIDSIKDHKILFPLVTLIIMDVFQQKMRLKKKRKALIIEEAWKAIASPLMAEYILYLYKTARKFWASIGVVTQEIQDIIDSPIVKQAIINNSDIIMLLDQSKFKERYDEIQSILGLTDVEKKKIFTINRLENKEGRSFFREVYIRRGTHGDVFGVEEPRECYMTYTTERAEKEAIQLYKRLMRCSIQEALTQYCQDWKRSGMDKSLAFAQRVNREGKVLRLPPRRED